MRFVSTLLLLVALGEVEALSGAETNQQPTFVQAPYQLTILKQKPATKRRFRDYTTTGRFFVCRVELLNQDTQEHEIDYSCFCAVDSEGSEYEVHREATTEKQMERADLNPMKDLDVWGFQHKTIKPKFRLNGWLVFEVPSTGIYTIQFRGYHK